MTHTLRFTGAAAILAIMGVQAISADPQKSLPRVGYVSPPGAAVWRKDFYEGLRESGFVNGENVVVTTRETGPDFSRADALADELVRLDSDVIVAQPARLAHEAQQAVQRAGKNTPIVFLSLDPVEEGFVTSLAHPDRNMTGVTTIVSSEIMTKHLELLQEVVPGVSRVAYLLDPTATPAFFEEVKRELEKAAAEKAIRLTIARVNSINEVEGVFAKLKREKVGALIVQQTAFSVGHRRDLIDAAARSRLPAIYGDELFVRDGGLIGYWTSMADMQRTLGRIVGAILKGKRPADLPIEQPMRFKLTINQKTANALGISYHRRYFSEPMRLSGNLIRSVGGKRCSTLLGISVPRTILMRADKIIIR